MRDQYVKTSVEQNGLLENILTDMNVIPRGNYSISQLIDQNTDLMSEKFGPRYVNINKNKLLNNWTKKEIGNFERRQDESLKNMEMHSKLNDSTQMMGDSSHAGITRPNLNRHSLKAMSNKSS